MAEPRKYRKQPVVVEAMLIPADPSAQDWAAFHKWVNGNDGRTRTDLHRGNAIATLEGDMYVSPGDYVIRGVAGEFYPCKPDIFEATYQPEYLEANDG